MARFKRFADGRDAVGPVDSVPDSAFHDARAEDRGSCYVSEKHRGSIRNNFALISILAGTGSEKRPVSG